MYISELRISNFRCFDGTEHIIRFNKGLSVLVGENDSGKTAILDAIRIALGTSDQSWYRIDSTDFYPPMGRRKQKAREDWRTRS